MATLSVWKFDDPSGAERVERKLIDLSKQQLITVLDAATVSWPADRKKPRTRQLSDLTGPGASWGALWGLLFGFLFLVPLLGAAIGAGIGALSGHFANVGIDEKFIKSVREKVTPGTSAMFLLSADAVIDRLHRELADEHPELVYTNLNAEQEARLREAFAE